MSEPRAFDGTSYARQLGARNAALFLAIAALSVFAAHMPAKFALVLKPALFAGYLGAIATIIPGRLHETGLSRGWLVPIMMAFASSALFVIGAPSPWGGTVAAGNLGATPAGIIAALSCLAVLCVAGVANAKAQMVERVGSDILMIFIVFSLAAIASLFLNIGSMLSKPLVTWVYEHKTRSSLPGMLLHAVPLLLAWLLRADIRKLRDEAESSIWSWAAAALAAIVLAVSAYFTLTNVTLLAVRVLDQVLLPPIPVFGRGLLEVIEVGALLLLPFVLGRLNHARDASGAALGTRVVSGFPSTAGGKGFGRRSGGATA